MPPTNTVSVLIDAKTLAREYLSVSLATVWRMRSDGKLPEPLKLTAQCLRWRRSDVEGWLAAGCPHQQQHPAAANGEASKGVCTPLAGEVTQ